jgi:hypothetical protein
LDFTEALGTVACLVTSKILGIGAAEQAWGDVKHLKTNKRSHLHIESLEMQSTLFGAACMQQARSKANQLLKDPLGAVNCTWCDEDMEAELGFDKWGVSFHLPKKPSRIFRAWVEDWEKENMKKEDPVSEARILEKYKDLTWYDPDTQKMFTTGNDKTHLARGRNGGYCACD